MPSKNSYLPVYVKADKNLKHALGTEEIEDQIVGSSPKVSERSLSPDVSFEISQAGDSVSQNVTWQQTILSPAHAFHVLEQFKENKSLLTPSALPNGTNIEGFNLPLLGQVKWEDWKKIAKEWFKNPKNLALLLWGLAVAISGAILFLVMVGLLDKQLPSKKQRDAWFEVNNQILNALFTMMCLYLHPQRCLHLVMLIRWHPQDISKLRKIYCKNGTYKPHEWAHMLAVVVLLQINCFAQYCLCGLNLGFKRSQRPAVGVGLCLALAIGASAAAGIYIIVSPLGKDFYVDEEGDLHMKEATLACKLKLGRTPSLRISRVPNLCFGTPSFASKDGALIDEPLWQGGLFDCYQDPAVTALSTVCAFCVFGWNMERLGFGNRYVHIVTFILLCTAPYWILTLAAINIDNVNVRKGLGISGIILSIFGLLYGGFWRIQMRKTYRLPESRWCFGKPVLADCTQWLFCSLCSLCQEVRTSEHYRVRDRNFYERRSDMSSAPSSSDRRSCRSFDFGFEASSPVPYRVYSPTHTSYSISPFSFSSSSSPEEAGKIDASKDDQINFLLHSKTSSPMLAPGLQVIDDRNNNHETTRINVTLFNANTQHNSQSEFSVGIPKNHQESQQIGSGLGKNSGDRVFSDRSNRL